MSGKTYTKAEIKEHNKQKDNWVAIHNKVYDITPWIYEHPGGRDVLVQASGSFATEQFEDANHSNDARDMMNKFYIGDVAEADKEKGAGKDGFSTAMKTAEKNEPQNTWMAPVGILLIAFILYFFVL